MLKCQYRSPHSGNWSECISGKFPSQSPMILVGQATGFSGAFWPATRREVLAIWTHPQANSSYRPRETAARLDFTLTLGSFRLIRSEMPLISLSSSNTWHFASDKVKVRFVSFAALRRSISARIRSFCEKNKGFYSSYTPADMTPIRNALTRKIESLYCTTQC